MHGKGTKEGPRSHLMREALTFMSASDTLDAWNASGTFLERVPAVCSCVGAAECRGPGTADDELKVPRMCLTFAAKFSSVSSGALNFSSERPARRKGQAGNDVLVRAEATHFALQNTFVCAVSDFNG